MIVARVFIRDARDEDAEAGAALLRNSIRQLCAADHQNDAAAISASIPNKTLAEFSAWPPTGGQSLLVAEREGQTAGVGLMCDDGELLLLYVAPEYVAPEFANSRVGKALANALEMRARSGGPRYLSLDSTRTALRFYEASGFAPAGPGPCG